MIFTVNYWKDRQDMKAKCLKTLARLARFERATAWFVVRRASEEKQGVTPFRYGEKRAKWLQISMLCALLQCAIPAHAVVVFGDSISACRTCWPAQLQAQGEWYKVLAQSMRFAVQYEIPEDLRPIDGHTEAVYFLGTNDATLDSAYPGEVFPHWKKQFHGHIKSLLDRGYRVLIVVLPTMPIESSQRFREHQQLYCGVMVHHFNVPNLACFDPDSIGYVTTDGAHPTEETSRGLGDAIRGKLRELEQ